MIKFRVTKQVTVESFENRCWICRKKYRSKEHFTVSVISLPNPLIKKEMPWFSGFLCSDICANMYMLQNL